MVAGREPGALAGLDVARLARRPHGTLGDRHAFAVRNRNGGRFFYADNQGDWMGSGGIVHVEKGDFTGHPAGLRWADRPESPVQVRLNDIYYRANPRFSTAGQSHKTGKYSRMKNRCRCLPWRGVVPGVKTPAVWLPHSILGISTSEIIHDTTNSAGFSGRLPGKLFVGDQGQSKIDRVFLEKVEGVWQGAAFCLPRRVSVGRAADVLGQRRFHVCWSNQPGLGLRRAKTPGDFNAWCGPVKHRLK
jgi:hypothetical protein